MVTIYDLLEVGEKASKEEIQKAYQKLIIEYAQDPKLTPKENADNELILNKVKIAYEILINDDKRAIYDKDLAKKRAEELIKNVSVNSEQSKIKKNVNNNLDTNNNSIIEENKQSDIYPETNENSQNTYREPNKSNENIYQETDQNEEITLSKEEQELLRKAAQNEFKANLKKAQKAEEEYNKAYKEAYNNYMKKMGYKVKEPITLKRIINVIIFIIVTLVVCFVAWLIPPIRNLLINLYNENIVIKSLVDLLGIILKAIIGIFNE